MHLEFVASRAVDGRGESQEAHNIIRSLFLHKIAAPHAVRFPLRKEHLMRTGQYRNLPLVPIYNTYNLTPDSLSQLTRRRSSLTTPSAPQTPPQSPAQVRAGGRADYLRVHGRPPHMLRLWSRLAAFDTRDATCETVVRVVLDETADSLPASAWMLTWMGLDGITPREAAELVVCAMEDCDEPPSPVWPV